MFTELFPKYIRLNRKKTDPNQFIFTGEEQQAHADIQSIIYDQENFSEEKGLAFSQIGAIKRDPQTHWLNIYGLGQVEELVNWLQSLGIDSLVIQDVLDLNQRPKYQEYEDYAFFTIKSTLPREANDLAVEQISFLFNSHYLISIQEKEADHFEHLRVRLRENRGLLRKKGPDFLLYTQIEAILDNYFRSLDRIEEEVNRMSWQNLKDNPKPDFLIEIEKRKELLQFFKKSIFPIKEFIELSLRQENSFVKPENQKYYFEIKDLCLTILDTCEQLNNNLESISNLFFSVQSHRMNQVMKTLTVVATVFIPLTFVVGVYGMNFQRIPELQWRYGYHLVWALNLAIVIAMLIFFKRKGWFD
jgi:magnesium transporter